ncbi:MAG: hypothetical protein AAF318_06495 [Pseudomonadota bacterium]
MAAERLICVEMFGRFRVVAPDGADLTPRSTKACAVLALLATARGQTRSRAMLADTLWSGAGQGASGSLRKALTEIRAAFGPHADVLQADRANVTLDPARTKAATDEPPSPLRGAFLEGLDAKDPVFEEWLREMRQVVDTPPPPAAPRAAATAVPPPANVPALTRAGLLPPIGPRVAVLPLRAIGSDAGADTLGDFIAEQVSRSLSRSSLLSVISHLSSRSVDNTKVDVAVVRDTMGADFCASGSVVVNGSKVTHYVDLVDVNRGTVLWSHEANGTVADCLHSDGPGYGTIVGRIGQTICQEAIRHANGRQLSAIDDHALLCAGAGLIHGPRAADFKRSKSLIDEAVRRAPRSVDARAWLAKWHVLSVFNGWTDNARRDTHLAIDEAARALDIQPTDGFALTVDGFAHSNLLKRGDIAASRYAEALRNNPSQALSWLMSGVLHAFSDNAGEAVAQVDRARMLSPLDPFSYYFDSLSATAYLAAEDFPRALEFADRAIASNDRHLSSLRVRITALHFLDRRREARQAMQELKRRKPGYTVDDYRRDHPAAQSRLGQNVIEALGASGLRD